METVQKRLKALKFQKPGIKKFKVEAEACQLILDEAGKFARNIELSEEQGEISTPCFADGQADHLCWKHR